MRRSACIALTAAASLLLAVPATAQHRRHRTREREPASTSSPSPPGGYALTNRLGVASSLRLLSSARREDRVRGVQRIAAQNDFAAVQVLLQAIAENASIVADPIVKIQAIRALAPFASRDPVRRVLAGWVVGDTTRLRAETGLGRDVQTSAALALAASGESRAIEQLVDFVVAGDDAAEPAAAALQAHPPSSLDPLLRARAGSSPHVLRLLGRLGDLRALPTLRKALADNDPVVAAEAAVALARLGDDSVASIARAWLTSPRSSPSTREAAAEALVLIRAPDAPRAIAILIADPATRPGGLQLAYDAPSPQLTPTLAGVLTILTGPPRSLAIAALSRCGGPLAVQTLEQLVTAAPTDPEPALALARCPSPAASESVARFLAASQTALVGARMALTRFVVLHDAPNGLDQGLRSLLSSPRSADRQTAAFGLVLTGSEAVATFLSARDPTLAGAACRAALARDRSVGAACAQALSGAASPALRDAIGLALIDPSDAASLSTHELVQWSETSRERAVLSARLLGARDSKLVRPILERLLASGDPVLRAQVALGLASSPDPSSVALLVDAFDVEPSAMVRRAIVRALSRRPSKLRSRWMRALSDLDPDPDVRALASLASRGVVLPTEPRGGDVVWVRVKPSGTGVRTARIVRIALADGLALLAVPDDDGFLMVPAVPATEVEISVAASDGIGESASP